MGKKKLNEYEIRALEETIDIVIDELNNIKKTSITEILADVKNAKKLKTSHNREARIKLKRLESNIKSIRLTLLDVWKLSDDSAERMRQYNKQYERTKNDNLF